MLRVAACLAIFLLSTAGCLVPPDGSGDRAGPSGQARDRVTRLLTNEVDSRVAIHAYYVEGREPAPAAMDWLAGRLKDITGKEEVTVEPFVPLATGTNSRSTNWTGQRADAVFYGLDLVDRPGTFEMVFLFLDGYGYSYGRAAGFQSDDGYIAMFPDAYRGAGITDPIEVIAPIPDPEGKEDRRVLLHESGHLLGLVDNGAPMVRDHVDRGEECLCHSSNPESIMASSVDTLTIVKSAIEPQDFDEDDLADLRAFQAAAASS